MVVQMMRKLVRQSSRLLKKCPSDVVCSVRGNTNFKVVPSVVVPSTLHSFILVVTHNHGSYSSELYCFMGESEVHTGSNRSSAIFTAIRESLHITVPESKEGPGAPGLVSQVTIHEQR